MGQWQRPKLTADSEIEKTRFETSLMNADISCKRNNVNRLMLPLNDKFY